jgi:nucleoside-diphosphate-sugar epimerase
MSVLLIGISGSSGEAIVTRLIAQADEVRVVEDDPAVAEHWRSLGAHVARRSDDMADLIERAAQNVRTVVIGGAAAHDAADVRAIVDGAAAARVERIVLYGAGATSDALEAVREFPFQHVVLSTGRRRLLGGRLDDESLAAAVDAADDIAGEPRLELDLGDPEAWPALGLSPP